MNRVFVLKYIHGGQGIFLTLKEGVNDLGRSRECDLQVQHKSISRSHARLMNTGESIWLDDLGSSAGTFVNGRRIEESVHLTVGDIVKFGDIEFKLVQETARPDLRSSESLEFMASKLAEDELTGVIRSK